jgi:hypothetical protein
MGAMRSLLLAVLFCTPALSASSAGPNTFTWLALEPPPIVLAGGYDIELTNTPGDSGPLLDQALALHLQDPNRGAPLGRRIDEAQAGSRPDHFAVLAGPNQVASVRAAAPSSRRGQRLVLGVVLEDPEYWEAWEIDQSQNEGTSGGWSFCLSRDATLRATLTATDPVDGRVVKQTPVEYVESATDCGVDRADAARRVTPESTLAEFAVDGLARHIADQVAPRWVAIEARLVRKGGAGRGHKLARSGDLRAATRWYVDASIKSPQDPWLRYHAAVLLTAGFHFAAARENLSAARMLADDPLFEVWEEELHRRERSSLMLRRIGVPQEPVRY